MDHSSQIKTAYEYVKSGDKNAARQILEDVLSQDPGNESAWYLMAHVAWNRQEAIQCLQKVLELNAANARARSELGQLQEQANRVASSPKPSQQKVKQSSNSKKWGTLLLGGCGTLAVLLIVVTIGVFLFNSQATQQIPPVAIDTQIPLATPTTQVSDLPVIPQPSPSVADENCGCDLVTAYFQRVSVRYAELESEASYINVSLAADQPIQDIDFIGMSGKAKAIYKEQVADTPPPCFTSFHQKTVSLFWNWQQAMEYASNNQYTATLVFIEGFTDKSSELESEADKVIEKLQNCPYFNDGGNNPLF
jgi:tetratricopeptide (TPR) repeat protein